MNENEPSSDRDELRDRLIDGSLRELVGGERPTDQTDRILAAAGILPAAELTRGGTAVDHAQSTARAGRFPVWVIAATLLIGGTVYMLTPSVQRAREAATRAPDQMTERDSPIKAAQKVHESAATSNSVVSAKGASTPATPTEEPDSGRIGYFLIEESMPEESLSTALSDKPEFEFQRNLAVAPKPAAPTQLSSEAAQGAPGDARDYGQGVGGYGGGYGGRDGYGGGYGRASRGSTARDYYTDGLATITEGRVALSDEPSDRELLRRKATDAEVFSFGLGFERGRGPDLSGDKYARIVDNPFLPVSVANTDNRLSTFSIDVDTASYANVRQFLMQENTLPPPDAVRIEELVNYFDYDYSPPTGDVPFASHVEIAGCPWNAEHRLVRIGIKGREMENRQRPSSNLVFLIDVSGSMDEPNKLPLLLEGMKLLTRELGENDRVAIVVYASTEGLAMESTRGDRQADILAALDRLHAGGSTAGGAGIQLAYQVAKDHFVKGGTNRVILCTDGDFNVGVTSPAELERMAEQNAKKTGVFLTVLGFGRGNLNDAMMEQIADKGNGNYHYVDGRSEARKVLVEEMTGTLVTIAKDVKIQVEFNPAHVAGYRLIGYENRMLAAEDFNDDKKDAGEIGAGHTVTALYEVVPAGKPVNAANVDELKYDAPKDYYNRGEVASATSNADAATSPDLLTLKIRYKQPDGDTSQKLEFPITDNGQSFAAASGDFRFATAVAGFGMLLRDSPHKGNATFASILETAESATGDKDPHGYQREFVEMVGRARELSGDVRTNDLRSVNH